MSDIEISNSIAILKARRGSTGSAFTVDLSNDMDSVACDNNGNAVAATNIYSEVIVLYGTSNVTSSCQIKYTAKPANCSVYLEQTNGGTAGTTSLTTDFQTIGSYKYIRLYFAQNASVASKEVLSLSVKHSTYGTINIDMPIIGLVGGATYHLVPSANAVAKRKNGTYDPVSISCDIKKIDVTSGAVTTNPSGASIKYIADGGSTENPYEEALVAGTDFQSYATFLLYYGGVIVDMESVNIAVDGKDGESALIIDIDNDSDQFGTDSTSKVLSQQTKETIVTMMYGTQLQDFSSTPSAVLKYDDGTEVNNSNVASVSVAQVASGNSSAYKVSVTIKQTQDGTTTMPFDSRNGLYVDITGVCAMGTRTIRFTLEKVMSGAKGESPTIYQLNLSQKSLTYGRDANNGLTNKSNSVTVGVKETIGDTTTFKTLLESGLSCSWGFDGTYNTYTVIPNTPTITVGAANVGSHTKISIMLSTGDKEEIPIVTDGDNGADGGNTATVYLYKRSATAISTVGIASMLYYKFATKKLYTDAACTTEATTQLNGWNLTIPAGTDPIYVTAAIAYSVTPADDIGSLEWVEPVQFTENGEHGINSATVFLYKRSASVPTGAAATPSQTLYYKFSDGKLYITSALTTVAATELNGWSLSMPATDGNPCYIIQSAALSTENYDPIATTDWSGVRELVKDGGSAFVVDLDPQMTSVGLNSTGNTTSSVDFYFYPRAYYGSTPVISDCTLTNNTPPTNITVTPDNTNKRFRVQINSGVAIAQANDITCTVTHATYGSRTVTFRLAGVKSGANGAPAVLQELTPSLSVISFTRTDADELTPSYRELSFSIKKTEGSATSTQTISQSGLTVRWSVSSMPATSSGGNAWGSGTVTGITWNSGSMRVANSIAYINIYVAAFNSSGTLVDMETIPIVKDGDNGDNGDDAIEYTVKTSVDNISIPSNEISATLSATATFYKKEGQNAEVAYSGYYGIYQRSGNSYTRIAYNSTTVSTYSISTEVTSAIDAIVIFLFSSNYSGSSPDTQAYLAKKEIVVNKKTDNVNPNILLRTVFDRGINPVKEIWWSGSWSYVGVEITNSNLLEGRHPLVIDGQSYGSDLDLSQNVYQKVKTSTWYTLSFYAKANASYNTFIYSGSSSYACIDVNAGIYIDGVFQSGSARQDGFVSWPSSGSFVRHTVTFKTKSTFNTTQVNIMFRASSSCKLYLCMPKLENGKVGTAYMAHESDLVGDEGVKGDAGRMYYYADVWDATNTTKTFTANDAQTPFFKVGSSYYVYVGSENFTDKTMSWINSNIGAPSSSDNDWQIMVSDFKYLITEAVFGNYAHFGANIINADYRFSQYGYVRGFNNMTVNINDSTQYTYIDPNDPFGTGEFLQNDRKIFNQSFSDYYAIAENHYGVLGSLIEFANSASPSESNIHGTYVSGDTHFRYKSSLSSQSFSSWIQFGNGDYAFAASANPSTSYQSPSTVSSNWQTTPPTLGSSQYLWLKISSSAALRVTYVKEFMLTAGRWYALEIDHFYNERDLDVRIGMQTNYITPQSANITYESYEFTTGGNTYPARRTYIMFKNDVFTANDTHLNIFIKHEGDVFFAALYACPFVPALCEDLKSGKLVLNSVIARGELHTDSLYYSVIPAIQYKEIFVRDNSIVTIAFNAYGTKVILPSPTVSAGRVIEIFSGLDDSASPSNPQKYQWKLSFEGAVESGNNKSYFKNLVGYSNNVYKAVNNFWKETYVKLFSDGTDWFVLKAEYTTTVNSEYVTVLATKYHP